MTSTIQPAPEPCFPPTHCSVATLWESITLTAVTYMLGVLFADQMWKQVILSHGMHQARATVKRATQSGAGPPSAKRVSAAIQRVSAVVQRSEGTTAYNGIKGNGMLKYADVSRERASTGTVGQASSSRICRHDGKEQDHSLRAWRPSPRLAACIAACIAARLKKMDPAIHASVN